MRFKIIHQGNEPSNLYHNVFGYNLISEGNYIKKKSHKSFQIKKDILGNQDGIMSPGHYFHPEDFILQSRWITLPMSNEKPVHHFKSMVPVDLTELWKRLLGLDWWWRLPWLQCLGKGSEAKPRFFSNLLYCVFVC